MSAQLAKQIYSAVKPLPDQYAQEVMNFVEFLSRKADEETTQMDGLMQAQSVSMQRVWDNDTDEAWNDVKPL